MKGRRLPRAADIYEALGDGASPARYGSHEIARVRAAEIASGWEPAELIPHLAVEDPEVRLVAAVLLAERSLAYPARRAVAIEALTPLIPSTQTVRVPDGAREGFAWADVTVDLGGEARALVARLATGVTLAQAAWRALVEAWLLADKIPPHVAQAFHEEESDLSFRMLWTRAFCGAAYGIARRDRALDALLAHAPGSPTGPDRRGPRHVLRGARLGYARAELLAAIQSASTPSELRFEWAVEWEFHDHARFRYFRTAVQKGTIEQARRYLVPYHRIDYSQTGPFLSAGPEPATPARWLAEGLAVAEEAERVREVFRSFNSLLGGFAGLKAGAGRESIAAVHAALIERPDAWARLMGEASAPHLPNLGLATVSVALRSPELTRCLNETVRLKRSRSRPFSSAATGFEDLDYALRWIRQGSPPG